MSHPLRVAIVDDDEPLRDALANLFRSAGFEALTFASGQLFLERDQSVRIDVIVTDYQMAGADGLAVIRALRARGDQTPAIVMTAHRHSLLKDRALEVGAADFLFKPFDAELLIEKVERAISARRRATNGSG